MRDLPWCSYSINQLLLSLINNLQTSKFVCPKVCNLGFGVPKTLSEGYIPWLGTHTERVHTLRPLFPDPPYPHSHPGSRVPFTLRALPGHWKDLKKPCCNLRITPYIILGNRSLDPFGCLLNTKPKTFNPTLDPHPQTRNPQSQTLNRKPETLDSKPKA